MIFDVIVILIFVALIALNVFRGAARALARFIATLVSYLGAAAIGQWLSLLAYNSFVRPKMEKAVTNAVSGVSTDAAENIISALPSWLTGIVDLKAEDLTNTLSGPISNATGTIAEAVNTAVKPVACGILTFFITIIAFLFLMIILQRILVKPLVRLFRFPVLNVVNRVGGAVIGLIDAVLLVCMLAYLTKLIIVNVGSNSSWFNESTINNSFIFYHFYSGNIFTWIGSLISGKS